MKQLAVFILLILTAVLQLQSQDYLCKKSMLDYSLTKSTASVFSVRKDSSKKDKSIKNPRTATILSAVLPGAGQFYNEKYWKIPVVYAGLAGFSAGIYYNQKGYKDATAAYLAETDTFDDTKNTQFPNIQSIEGLRSIRNSYRNYRDVSIVGISLFYVLQIVDAAVDAHFSGFDPDKPLSIKFNPLPNNGLAMAVRWQF